MSTQMDTRRTGPLCVLRRNRPTKAVPEELRESAKPAESKLTRSNEWRNAYRRFSFIFDPFKRRAKSADPRANENGLNDSPFRSDFKTVGFNSNGTFNGFTDQNQPTDARTLVSSCPNQTNAIADWKSSDVVVCTLCSTPLTQPSLISVCGRSDPQTEQLYVSPVNITGQIFEHYRRTRGTANLIGPRTQLNGQMDLNYGRVTRQTGVSWIPTTNRPASFHPVLPQRDESNPPPHSHHNPYAYQNSYSSSEVTSQNGEQSHRSPYHSFRPEPTPGKPESGRKKSTMYDSLYDYPPTLSPFPCPTYRPDIGVHGRINARASFPMNSIRKRVTRPASINPVPTFTSSSRAVARPPTIPNLIGDFDSQWSNSRSHTHSVDRSRLTDLGKRHVSWEKPVTVTTTNQTTTTTTAIKRNNNSVTSVYGFRSSSITDSEQSDSLIQPVVYPHLVRSQSGDSSGAVCQVTVCHLAPKLCATVAETATRLQRRPKLSIPSRPRSTLVTSSDQLNLTEQVLSTIRPNVRPQPDTYLVPSRGSVRLSDSACGLLNGRDLKNPEWATCSNAASFSIRQRRGLDHDRDQSNGTAYPANSVQRIRPAPPAETRSSSMSGRGIKNPNGFLDRQIGCACKVSPVLLVSSDQKDPASKELDNSVEDRLSPIFWNSIPEGNRPLLMDGPKSNSKMCPINRNSWSAQPVSANGCWSRESDPTATPTSDITNSMQTSMTDEDNSWSAGSVTRPTSIVLIPGAVCLPPPIGSRINVRPRVPLTITVTSSSTSFGICGNGANSRVEDARRFRTSTVPGIRPPRPPTRTTSLVRGIETESRDASRTPPITDSGTPIHNRESKRSESIAPAVNTAKSTTCPTLSDHGSDSLDKLADNEVEQTVVERDSVWWLNLLPYKPSNLPTNLADRLRQRNSLVLARCSPNTRLSNSSLPTPLSCQIQPLQPVSMLGTRLTAITDGSRSSQPPVMMMMMTQSLYEQRDPIDQTYTARDQQRSPPDLTTPRGSRYDLPTTRVSRVRLPIRPSSLYMDKPDPPVVFMPSLAHLSGLGCSSSSGETGLSRTGTVWNRHASTSHTNQSDGSSPRPPTSPSLSGDSISTDPLSMLSSYTSATVPPIEPVISKEWSLDKTDSPLLGQYCRLLNLRTANNKNTDDNNPNNPTDVGTSETPGDLLTPSAGTPLTPV